MSAIDYSKQLGEFIGENPCNFFVVDSQARKLESAGYARLSEGESWDIRPGGKYFVTRNGSAIAAFRIPAECDGAQCGFMVFASHSDSPTLRVKANPEIRTAGSGDGANPSGYSQLNVELYGGMLQSTWFDRPLSVAGRIVLRDGENGIRTQLVKIERDLLMIPSLAIHMNRDANKGYEFNAQKDLLPLIGCSDARDFLEILAQEAEVAVEDILSHEMVLYVRQVPSIWGDSGEFFSAPRLDDVQCAFSSLAGFLESEACAGESASPSIPVHVVFDNEEVGSSTKQGAASTFLLDTLRRIVGAFDPSHEAYARAIANSFMISGDNGHALHPNYPEKCDPTNRVCLGDGLLIKHAANQKYTTDATSEAICRMLAQRAGVPVRDFFNRSDIPGGSTLGNISGNQVPICTVDVGAPQLAMHSCYETCSVEDTLRLVKLARELFSSSVRQTGPGSYSLLP